MPRRLQNTAIRYQVLLERLKAHEVEDLWQAFQEIDRATRDIIEYLAADGIGNITRRELTALLSELRQTNAEILDRGIRRMYSTLETLAHDSATFEFATLKRLPAKLKIFEITAEKAFEWAKAQPISATGQLLDTFVSEWTKGEINRLNNITQRAWGEGWTNQKLIQAIRGTKALKYKDGILATSRRNADAVSRTAIQHTASAAREATWAANVDVVSGVIWISTLDGVTTQICRSLDRKRFNVGQGPRPPAHIRCRSTTIAEIRKDLGLDFLDRGGTRSSVDGPVDANLSYYEWLKTQDAEFQNEALGKTRAILFRDGGLSAERFAELNLSKDFQPLTLDEMRAIAPVAFDKAGLGKP